MPDSGRWTNGFLDEMREVGDPRAGKAAAAMLESGHVKELSQLLRSLAHVDQAAPEGLPAEVAAYFAETASLPGDVDRARIRRAQTFFQTNGLKISACLFCASLPSSYAAAKGAQVLAITGRLDSDARRRIFETGQFLMDVMAVGGLDERGTGIRTAQRVRLMHGGIRHLICKRNESAKLWDATWGVPINQEDLAGTMLAFALVPADPLRRLNVEVSDAEASDYLYAWKMIGLLMGVKEEMLPNDLDDAAALVAAIKRRHYRPSPEGRELTAALVTLLDDLTPTQWADRFIPMFIRHLIGDDVAKIIALPTSAPAAVRWFPRPLLRVLSRTGVYMDKSLEMARLAEPFGREFLQAVFDFQRRGVRATFDIPTELADEWNLVR